MIFWFFFIKKKEHYISKKIESIQYQKMQIHICNTYDELSATVADKVIELMSLYEQPLLCPASGDTPAGLYKALVEKYRKKSFDPLSWSFVGLDEWGGLNGSDEGSCRYSIDKELFHPLNVALDKIAFFDGRATDLEKECTGAENFIKEKKGLRVSILGLGMNGHIAMNEPGCAIDGRAQIVQLHPVTKQVGQKYFQQPQALNEGITLGMGTLLESQHIILMVSGKHKAEIVKKVLEGSLTNEVPGSLLRNHASLNVYLDADAASLLENKNEYAQ
ncbi:MULTISPECIES: 6-phosphogluconolactonase [Chitinophagaceae]